MEDSVEDSEIKRIMQVESETVTGLKLQSQLTSCPTSNGRNGRQAGHFSECSRYADLGVGLGLDTVLRLMNPHEYGGFELSRACDVGWLTIVEKIIDPLRITR